ncbi:hypothetical protein RJ55_02917 [Drechmeria coniospora]|nr:hypothetical protein RJ55_02917 [Drechmeria coniospora]
MQRDNSSSTFVNHARQGSTSPSVSRRLQVSSQGACGPVAEAGALQTARHHIHPPVGVDVGGGGGGTNRHERSWALDAPTSLHLLRQLDVPHGRRASAGGDGFRLPCLACRVPPILSSRFDMGRVRRQPRDGRRQRSTTSNRPVDELSRIRMACVGTGGCIRAVSLPSESRQQAAGPQLARIATYCHYLRHPPSRAPSSHSPTHSLPATGPGTWTVQLMVSRCRLLPVVEPMAHRQHAACACRTARRTCEELSFPECLRVNGHVYPGIGVLALSWRTRT